MENTTLYQGATVEKDYPAQIVAAQQQQTYRINGQDYARIPYQGEFYWPDGEVGDSGRGSTICYECLVAQGQLHVPGCVLEECPVCGGMVAKCDCPVEGLDKRATAASAGSSVSLSPP